MEQMSPLLLAKLEQQQAYQTQNNTNPFVSTPKVNIGGAKLEQLDKDTVALSTNNNSEFDYSTDDGKISFGDKLKNFGKGLITPITAMFSSPKNFLIGAGMIAGGAALTIATGGAIAPLFVALGVTGGAIQLGTSIVKAHNATTDDEAKSAYQGIGAGTSAVTMSVLGSKAALKGAGVDTKGMSFLRATAECFRQVPSSVSKSVGAFTSGQALTNIKNVFKPKKSTNSETNSEPKSETTSEPKTENNTKAKTENSTETKPDTKAEPKTEPKTEQNVEPKPETKAEAQTEQSKAPEAKETACKTETEPKQNNKPKAESKAEIKESTAKVQAEQTKAIETETKPVTEESTIAESTEARKPMGANKGTGTYEDPIIISENVATSTNTKVTEFTYRGADGKYYKSNITYDSNLPDVPDQWRGRGSDLWDKYHVELRDMQYNNGELSAAKKQDIISAANKSLESRLRRRISSGIDRETAMADLMSREEFSDPVGYHMEQINDALEDTSKLFQSFKPTTKEGYLYRGMTITNDPKLNNVFHCEDFFNMINSLQEGQTFTLDYSPICTGGIDVCKQYAGNTMFKIKVPIGAKLMHSGLEYRFPPKAQFIFNGVKELEGGMKFYDLEYILPTE